MKSELKQIQNASFAKRILAVIMDAAFTLFTMFAFIAFIFVPIANKGLKYTEKVSKRLHYQIASSLFVYYDTNEDGTYKFYNISNLNEISDDAKSNVISEFEGQEDEFYINHVRYYFLNYKTGVGVDYPETANPEDYKAPNCNDLIDGKSPSEIYTNDWFNAKVEELKTPTALMEFAFDDMSKQEYYLQTNKDIKAVQLFIIMPPMLLSFSIFFIVFPLVFKNGETLGKKTMHLCLINKDGYDVQKRQIVFRQTLLLLYVTFCSFIIGVGLTSFATLGVGVLIYFVAAFIPKSHRSPADYASYTLLVDSLHSVWFKDALEEVRKDAEIAENIEKYKQNKVENKNIIQVGSTIVNEDIKREIEEEKKEHKKS